jgi:hypothetical protein
MDADKQYVYFVNAIDVSHDIEQSVSYTLFILFQHQ